MNFRQHKTKSGDTFLLLPPAVYEDLKRRADLKQSPEERKVLSLQDQLVEVLNNPQLTDQQKMEQYGQLTFIYRDWLKKLKTGEQQQPAAAEKEPPAVPVYQKVQEEDSPQDQQEDEGEEEENQDIDLQSRPAYSFQKLVDGQPESAREKISNFLDQIRENEERGNIGWNRRSGEVFVNSKKIPGSNMRKILSYLFVPVVGKKGAAPAGTNLLLGKYKTLKLNQDYLPALGKLGGGGQKRHQVTNGNWKKWQRLDML